MKKIILIDGNSLMFRSYYATAYHNQLMQNKHGLFTNAIYGFCMMLTKIQSEEMSHIFVAFDAGSKTFRHQQFETYKGTRKKLPEELAVQIPYIKKYLDIIKVKRYEMQEFEADDLIASVAELASKKGFDEIKIVTGDKDLLQLVSENTQVYITKRGATELEEYNIDNFYEKMQVHPHQIPDYKGLVGDSSDNLPGIKGIGDKTATKLLNQFKSLESILENLSLIKGKTKETIENGYKLGLECKGLAILKKDIKLDFDLDDMVVRDSNKSELISFYKELDFESLLKKLDNQEIKQKQINYHIIDSNYDFSSFDNIIINIEVFGTNYLNGEFLGLGIIANDESFFVTPEEVIKNTSLHQLLKDQTKNKSTFDYKKLYVVLKKHGIEINNVGFDLLLAAYILDPSSVSEDFKKLADNYTINNVNYDEIIYGFKSKAKIPDLDVIALHALTKSYVIKDLEPQLIEKIKAAEQTELFNIEMQLSLVLGDMELDGLKIDREKLEEIEQNLSVKQTEVANQVYELAGEQFNINSVKQLSIILFEKMGLPTGKKNKTGYSTSSDVLEKLSDEYEIAKKVLEYRGITKLISTYVKGLYEVMTNNYVHPLYKQALTMTGRLSSIEPNIQNMPIRTELGKVIRESFISRYSNGKIMSSDYSQIELRILAHLSNDQTMISMFNENVDFHMQTAMKMYDVGIEQVTKDMRRTAKAINFGIIYGMSAWGLSETIDIKPIDAGVYIDKYFATFNDVKKYLDNTVENAKKNGYTKTILNRIRYIPELRNDNRALQGFGERTAMNSPIQGSAADIIKKAMIEVKNNMKNLKSIMIAQVHDELVFDVHPDEIKELQKIIKENMENVMKLKVPLVIDTSYGDNWLKI